MWVWLIDLLSFCDQMTKNKLNFANTRKQIEAFLPDEMKEPLLKTMDICEKSIEIAKTACDTAYKWVDRKMYQNN